MMDKLIKLILRHDRLLFVLALVFSAIILFNLPRLRISAETSEIYPPRDDPDRIFLDQTYRDFGGDFFLIVAVSADNLFTYQTLKKIGAITEDIEKLDTVHHVISLTNVNIIRSKGEELSLQNISENIPRAKAGIDQFRRDILSNPLYRDKLVSQDLKTTSITVFFDESQPLDTILKTEKRIEEITQKAAGPEELYVAGPMAIKNAISENMAKDFGTYLPVTMLIIFVILFAYFRNWRIVVISLICNVLTIACTYSFMAFLNVPVNVLTTSLPPVIAAQGLSYCIHIFAEYAVQLKAEAEPKSAVERTLRNVLLAVWLSSITTTIGFLSISPVRVVAIKAMGMFLAVGVVFLFLFVTFLVPPLVIYLFPRPVSKPGKPKAKRGNLVIQFTRLCIRYRILIFIAGALLAAVSAYGMKKILVETDVHQFFSKRTAIRQAFNVVSSRLKSASSVSLILEGKNRDDIEDPAFLESVGRLQSVLEGEDIVGSTTSVVDYLKIINKALHNNDPKYYVLPDTKEAVAQYLLIYSLADPEKTLNSYIDYDHRIAKLEITTSSTNSARLIKFKKFIDGECSLIIPPDYKCTVTSGSMLLAKTSQDLSRGILYGFSQAALAIFLIMLYMFRSLKMGIVAMIPNLLPLLFVLGIMGFGGIYFNIGTSIVICISIGIAVDDTIHFLVRFFYELKRTNHYLIRASTGVRITDDQKKAILITFDNQCRPIVLIAFVMILGFIVLTLSSFVPIASFGFLTASAMFMGIVCELLILPALLASISI